MMCNSLSGLPPEQAVVFCEPQALEIAVSFQRGVLSPALEWHLSQGIRALFEREWAGLGDLRFLCNGDCHDHVQ
jgi:hypothetical protein